MDQMFADGLRESLIQQIEAAPRRRRARLWRWGVGSLLVAGLLGGGTAFAAQLWAQPGSEEHTSLAAPVVTSEVGTATIELGARPKGASAVALQFFPQDAGTYTFGRDGASETVTVSMLEPAEGATGTAPTSPRATAEYLQLSQLDPGGTSLTITTSSPTLHWSASLTWVSSHTTPWGMNTSGQTYGVQNTHGTPDLIAVTATNGNEGYVYRKDLDAADGTTAAKNFRSPQDALKWQKQHQNEAIELPVYESDGTTKIGTFCIGTRC